MSTDIDCRSRAAVERVRAAIAAAPAERMARLVGPLRRVLEARAQAQTLREIGERMRVTRQAIAHRERCALEALARDPLERMGEPETDLTLDTVEQIDALERARGGKWRESRTLAPDETVIEDARLT